MPKTIFGVILNKTLNALHLDAFICPENYEFGTLTPSLPLKIKLSNFI